MKQKFLLLLLSFAACNLFAQDVPETQTPLVSKITATWCVNCGTWGWDLFDGLINENEDKAILIATHFSGDLDTPVGRAFADNFGVFAQPRFILNNEDKNGSRNSVQSKITEITDEINTMSLQSPVANVGFYAEMVDGKIQVQTKTKFFQQAEGEYYLGLYVVEEGVVNNQSGQGANTVHKTIMRASIDTENFGSRLSMMNTLGAGMEFSGNHSIDIDSDWNTDNISVVGMIWKKEGAKYQFVNANSTNDFSGNTSSVENDFVEVDNYSVAPTVINDQATVSLNLSQSIENATLNLYAIDGKKIGSIYSGNLSVGAHTFQINRSDFTNTGMVLVTLEKDGLRLSKKVIVE